jgi:predicted site-specific integrase-resolvase
MFENDTIDKLGASLTVGEAAAFLGVPPSTLRNWDRAGKVCPARHPINHYRLYRREELPALMRAVVRPGSPSTPKRK